MTQPPQIESLVPHKLESGFLFASVLTLSA